MTSPEDATLAAHDTSLSQRDIARAAWREIATKIADAARPLQVGQRGAQSPRFAYTKLSGWDLTYVRIGGPGLGNLLFPWARAVVGCHQHGLIPLAVTWPQIKIGPYLRREPDKRHYFRLFQSLPEEVRGLRRAVVLATAAHFSESAFRAAPDRVAPGSVVVYEGMEDMFLPILGDARIVRDRLHRMVRARHQRSIPAEIARTIGIHVRLGDFQPTNAEALQRGTGSIRMPIAWYGAALDRLRVALPDAPIRVFSDGTDAELADLLNRKGVIRATYGSALADLLAMSRTRALIASGSTFSMWACYLGRMPVIWYPGQLKQRLYLERPDAEIEHAGQDPLPAAFVASLSQTT